MEFQFQNKAFHFPDLPPEEHITKRIRKKRTFYEVDMLTALSKRVPSGGWIVDCGANIGNHTVFFAGVMGNSCISFEPIAKNRVILARMIEANKLGDLVQIRSQALGDTAGEVLLASPNDQNAGMYRVVEASENAETASMIRLDDALTSDQRPVRLIKIDVEGYEANVLRGAFETVARDRPIIVAELANVAEYDQFRADLKAHDYVAAELYNATPTVVFTPDGSENGKSIREDIAEFEKKTQRAR